MTTKRDRREQKIVTVTDIQKFHALYGAPFEDCPCGGKRPEKGASCASCRRPHADVYIKPKEGV